MKLPLIAASAPDALAAQQELHRILTTARALFFEQGLEAVTMDQLAAQPGISALGLQERFASKAALVSAVVEQFADYMRAEISLQNTQSSTAVEELLALRVWSRRELGEIRGPFFQELKGHYPTAWQLWQDHTNGFMYQHVRNNLRWGILQDLYRDTIEVDFLAQLWIRQMGLLMHDDMAGLPPAEVQHTLTEQFLAGIVTPGGAHVARRLQEAAPFY